LKKKIPRNFVKKYCQEIQVHCHRWPGEKDHDENEIQVHCHGWPGEKDHDENLVLRSIKTVLKQY
jgi:hypothetical protein